MPDLSTLLLVHCDGTDGSTTFTDSSPLGHTITANGDAQVDTAYKKFGTGALLLDGSGDYLSIPDHDCWDFGTGEFTLETWFRPNALPAVTYQCLMDVGDGHDLGISVFVYQATTIRVRIKNTGYYDYAVSLSTGTWYHMATVRAGNTLKVFLDGVQKGSDQDITSTDITGTVDGVKIGWAPFDTGYPFNGWMDEVRVSDVARWTTDFTPPAVPYNGMTRGVPLWWGRTGG